nr:hypothetical protein [Tanacetum cinerariifolium]
MHRRGRRLAISSGGREVVPVLANFDRRYVRTNAVRNRPVRTRSMINRHGTSCLHSSRNGGVNA